MGRPVDEVKTRNTVELHLPREDCAIQPLLAIRALTVRYGGPAGAPPALDGFDLDLEAGAIVGLVGESGSGKSTVAHAVLGLIDAPATWRAGRLQFDGVDLQSCSAAVRRKIAGASIGAVFQDPVASLDPCRTIGDQLVEVLLAHAPLGRSQARARALELLAEVEIPAARSNDHPHQLSGGMCQRVVIALALAHRPRLLVADEPTTALDLTVQAQIVDLVLRLQREHGMAVLWISHDLPLISQVAERVIVLRGGRIVEQGRAAELFAAPADPYTKGLVAAMRAFDQGARRPLPEPRA